MAVSVRGAMNLFLIILLTHATINLSFGRSNGDDVVCIENEKKALLSFKQDLVDPLNMLLSWVSQENCCKWAGIVCNNLTGHVEELHLDNSSLQGKINPGLLGLNHLNYLDLSNNDFGRIRIPSFIGSLESLTYLNLTNAGFKGIIPHQLGNLSSLRCLGLQGQYGSSDQSELYVENLHWLSGLSSLQQLDMSNVNLSKASDHWLQVINMLSSLSELHLSSCELARIPSIFHVNFTSLSILNISSNNFHSPLPNWLFTFKSLVYLDLQGSDFQGPIPCAIQNLTALRYLDLSESNFESTIIPSCLFDMPRLEYLNISSNNLEGVIASAIQNLTSIVKLDLSYNALEGIVPTSVGNLCNLEFINLGGNKFGGNVSNAFDSLLSGCLSNSLMSLDLSRNFFSGHLTDQVVQFKNLVSLSLRNNSISGPIPVSFGKLSALENMDVAFNQLNGSLPESLGGLSNLRELHISSNLFEGVVSEVHFANLTNLKVLYAYQNSLALRVNPDWIPPFQLKLMDLRLWNLGPQFPMWLKTQHNFRYIGLSNTQISDVIPKWFWNVSSGFSYMNLSHNQISGGFPDMIGGSFSYIYLGSNNFNGLLPRISSDVRELDLSYNSFSGDISHLLCHPMGTTNELRILHLGENLLSGKIPDCWMHWPELQVINLHNNNLTGEIPGSIGSLHSLGSLHLHNNSLSGEILPSLQNCGELTVLDLGLNEFTGGIPKWEGTGLPKLKVLSLRSNKLKGDIPFELCNLTALQIIDVAHNNLSGVIPKCFNNFKAMATKQESSGRISYNAYYNYADFLEDAFVVTKGRENQYNTILTLVCSLDLSCNKLTGEIPPQLTALQGLLSLNLSQNFLKGSIPHGIGNMKSLESLDLSINQLSGVIPQSMSGLNFLSSLNFSYNNLSGKIPSSTQLQSLDASSFIGNELCGPPLSTNCEGDQTKPTTENGGQNEVDEAEYGWFHLGIAIGFAVGFFGVIAPVLFCITWRHAYFEFFGYIWYKILYKNNCLWINFM